MASKKIVTVGFYLNTNVVEYLDFGSDRSLHDFDIILFAPNISPYLSSEKGSNTIPRIARKNQTNLVNQLVHWQSELTEACDVGKTVIIFLTDLLFFMLQDDAGDWNQFNNYFCFPIEVLPKKKLSKLMKLTNEGSFLKQYWEHFEKNSDFRVIVDASTSPIVSKISNKAVSSVVTASEGTGVYVMLPNLSFPSIRTTYESGTARKVYVDVDNMMSKFITSIKSIDRHFQKKDDVTPIPPWAMSEAFDLKQEISLTNDLSRLNQEIATLNVHKNTAVAALAEESVLRRLLFETGKPLEKAILKALKLLGFEAESYDDGISEFDAVFKCDDGRLLGEAEGKNNEKAVHIAKLRQINTNIDEDFAKDDVNVRAKGVLFGNTQRLTSLPDRTVDFTEKCQTSAEVTSIALVYTPDLFVVAQYLSDNKNPAYAKKCRKVLLERKGRVTFPPIPKSK